MKYKAGQVVYLEKYGTNGRNVIFRDEQKIFHSYSNIQYCKHEKVVVMRQQARLELLQ
jgi:hypothetical protein